MDTILPGDSTRRQSLFRAGAWFAYLLMLSSCGGGGDAPQCSFFSSTCVPDVTGGVTLSPSASVAPGRVTLQAGSAVVIRVFFVEVANPAFQWQWSLDRGNSYVDIPGATSDTLSQVVSLADDGAMFRVFVRGTGGVQVSATGQVNVSPLPPVTFADGEFLPENWRVTTIMSPAENGPAQTQTRRQADGNPGAYRSMEHVMSAGASSLRVAHISESAIYDPATQGAILAIDYAENCRVQDRSYPTLSLQWNLVLEQSGRRFHYFAYSECVALLWGSMARSSLVPSDFAQLDGPACVTSEACPDFSASAKPLRFGFERRTFVPEGLPAGTVTHGIDNWKVSVWKK